MSLVLVLKYFVAFSLVLSSFLNCLVNWLTSSATTLRFTSSGCPEASPRCDLIDLMIRLNLVLIPPKESHFFLKRPCDGSCLDLSLNVSPMISESSSESESSFDEGSSKTGGYVFWMLSSFSLREVSSTSLVLVTLGCRSCNTSWWHQVAGCLIISWSGSVPFMT